MSKRSREVSLSPSAGDSRASADDTGSLDDNDIEADITRPVKFSALARPETHELPLPVMQCILPPHRHALDFSSIEAFELHYQQHHTNRCISCARNFPSAHYLSLHLDEYHNSLRAEIQAKGEKTYACFVQDCDRKCSTPQKRRLHLIDKHAFPRNYNFRVIHDGIDKSTSMLTDSRPQRRRVSTVGAPADTVTRHRRSLSHSATDTTKNLAATSSTASQSVVSHNIADSASTANLDDLTTRMSALQFVPPSLRRSQPKDPKN
jgi:hypothetical protein